MSVKQVNERLAALTAVGTSVWLDQLRRGMIEGGEVQRMVEEDSLRGVWSAPSSDRDAKTPGGRCVGAERKDSE